MFSLTCYRIQVVVEEYLVFAELMQSVNTYSKSYIKLYNLYVKQLKYVTKTNQNYKKIILNRYKKE